MNKQVQAIRTELEEEIKAYFQGLWPGLETAEQCNTNMQFTPPAIMRLAKHFYKLGQASMRIPEEQPSKDLEEAAEKWCKENGRGFVLRDKSAYYIGETLPAFKAGAKWQEDQMLKDAIEGEARVGYPFSKPFIDIEQSSTQWCNIMKKFMNGDKVKIIIVKEDEQ